MLHDNKFKKVTGKPLVCERAKFLVTTPVFSNVIARMEYLHAHFYTSARKHTCITYPDFQIDYFFVPIIEHWLELIYIENSNADCF